MNNEGVDSVIIVIKPFVALTLFAALETVEQKTIDLPRSLFDSIQEYKTQINKQITTAQVNDAEAELALRQLLGTY